MDDYLEDWLNVLLLYYYIFIDFVVEVDYDLILIIEIKLW